MKFARQKDDENRCPECSARLTDHSLGGPCPACLMKLGMQTWQENRSAGMRQAEATLAAADLPPGEWAVDELASKFPQYELLHQVGSGGMGVVYCARQKSLNRLVARKVIKPDAGQRAEFEDRFAREAQAMAKLNHNHIVTVHDFGEVDGLYFLVMEYVDGINLRQMIRGNRLSGKQALEIVPTICDALQYAHDRGIVHRDIKPENILVDTAGVVKIADFGLAKLLDQEASGPPLTRAHHVMGTMHYMAPEQIETPLQVDHRADIYSLGVVIYELLTGELPLGRFSPPSHKVSIDVRLDEIVMQSLAREPALRYQRVGDVKTDMQSISTSGAPSMSGPGSASGPESPIPAGPPAAPIAAAGQKPLPPTQPWGSDPTGPGPVPRCGMLAAVVHPQTWSNFAYTLLGMPLGVLYLSFIVSGLALGLGTLIIWVGLFVLLAVFLAIRGFLSLERHLTIHLLGTTIPDPRSSRPAEPASISQQFRRLALSAETWRGVCYLLSRFVTGTISFSLSVAFLAVPLALIASPVIWGIFGVEHDFVGSDGSTFRIDSYRKATFACMAGLLFVPVVVWILNRLAWLNAKWARLWLGR